MSDAPPWSSRKLRLAIYFEHVWVALLGALVWTRPEHTALALDTLEALTAVTLGGYFVGNVGEWFARRQA